jgi:hypothetical protein
VAAPIHPTPSPSPAPTALSPPAPSAAPTPAAATITAPAAAVVEQYEAPEDFWTLSESGPLTVGSGAVYPSSAVGPASHCSPCYRIHSAQETMGPSLPVLSERIAPEPLILFTIYRFIAQSLDPYTIFVNEYSPLWIQIPWTKRRETPSRPSSMGLLNAFWAGVEASTGTLLANTRASTQADAAADADADAAAAEEARWWGLEDIACHVNDAHVEILVS